MSAWISVKDQMPEDDVEVLINGSEGVEVARYMLAEDDCPDSMGHDAGWCGYKFAMPGRSFGAESYMCQAQGQPTHWMPLPEAPEADDDDHACPYCSGTGEGSHDGARCGHCKGRG